MAARRTMDTGTDRAAARGCPCVPAAWFAALALTAAAAGGCAGNKQPVSADFMTMGTFASVSVPAGDAGRLPEISKLTQGWLSGLEDSLSIYNPDSEISRINAGAGMKPVAISGHAMKVLGTASAYGDLSGGVFDVTILPVLSLWGFGPGARKRSDASFDAPGAVELAAALDLVDYKLLVLEENTARLGKSGMKLDLGGIAKGYAVDVCYENLLGMGYSNLLVNIGGNIRCAGSPRGDRPWQVGVRNPMAAGGGKLIGVLRLTGGLATATSGNYERFITIKGRKYCHIIDPRTGRPAEGMAGVTVICTNATEADALSTTLFLLGVEKGTELAERLPGVGAIFVPDRLPMEIHVTSRARKYFKPAAATSDY